MAGLSDAGLLPLPLREAFLERYAKKLDLFKRLLTQNLALTSERVLIISDTGEPGKRIAPMLNTLYYAAAKSLGLHVEVVTQSVKLRGDVTSANVVQAMDSLPPGNAILLNVSKRIGNLSSLGLSYRTFCKERKHKFFSSSNLGLVSDDQFDDVLKALDVDYDRLREEGDELKALLDKASVIRITTPAGTDVTIKKEGVKAINNNGFYIKPGAGGNMPAGEVYFPPLKHGVNGQVVIDGSYRTKEASIIPHEPIVMLVRDGRIINFNRTPEAKALERTLQWAESRAKHPWGIRFIGELGIGLNPGAKLIGCTILDEKVRGTVHVANGSNKWFGGSITAIIHLDHVMRDPTMYIDGEEYPLPASKND